MELKFTKDAQSGNWVSEYEAKAGFNLHIEGAKKLRLYQRTAGSRYDEIEGEYKDGAYSFDYDFEALVYPKYIKIVSETEPTYAEVVSDGEITEIKSQTKEVEVTANGTTQVAPDAGYSYLTGVTVKTNVPQSGGSGGEGGSTWKYFLFPEGFSEEGAASIASLFGLIVKMKSKEGMVIAAPGLGYTGFSSPTILGIATDGNARIMLKTGETFTMDECAAVQSGGVANNVEEFMKLGGIVKITKEEFYNLES